MAHERVRGMLGSCVQLMVVLGIMGVYLAGTWLPIGKLRKSLLPKVNYVHISFFFLPRQACRCSYVFFFFFGSSQPPINQSLRCQCVAACRSVCGLALAGGVRGGAAHAAHCVHVLHAGDAALPAAAGQAARGRGGAALPAGASGGRGVGVRPHRGGLRPTGRLRGGGGGGGLFCNVLQP